MYDSAANVNVGIDPIPSKHRTTVANTADGLWASLTEVRG